MYFTNEERKVLFWLVVDEKLSLRKTAARFHQQFPNRPKPSPQTISDLIAKVRETGSVFTKPKSGRPKSATVEANEVLVLATVYESRQQSLREISWATGITQTSAWRILHRYKFHPYGVHLVQELSEADFERRMDYCELMDLRMRDPNYVRRICFTDEATFHLCGYVNRHNLRFWCEENPYEYREEHTQTPLKVNVWAGIFGTKIIGPFFIEGNLNRFKYLDLLENHAIPAIEQAADDQCIDIDDVIFQQDGHPAHFANILKNYLHLTFPNRWIGRGGPTLWPPRSPDLTPLDFFLWGYLKDRVFRTKPDNVQDMMDRIIENSRLPDEEMLERVMNAVHSRILICITEEGKQFEHLL